MYSAIDAHLQKVRSAPQVTQHSRTRLDDRYPAKRAWPWRSRLPAEAEAQAHRWPWTDGESPARHELSAHTHATDAQRARDAGDVEGRSVHREQPAYLLEIGVQPGPRAVLGPGPTEERHLRRAQPKHPGGQELELSGGHLWQAQPHPRIGRAAARVPADVPDSIGVARQARFR